MADFVIIPGKSDVAADATYVGGAKPSSAGDRVFAYQGAQTLTGTMPVNLNHFYLGPEFLGNVGSDSTPLVCNVNNGTGPRLVWASRGNGRCSVSGTVTKAEATGSGRFYAAGGEFEFLDIAGNVQAFVDASCAIKATSGRAIVSSHGASLRIAAYSGGGTATAALAVAAAGTIESARTCLTARAGAGRLRFTDDAAVSTALEAYSLQAMIEFLAGGVIAQLNMYAGKFRGEGNRFGNVTATNALLSSAADVQQRWSNGGLVFSNDPVYSGPPSGLTEG